jgi:hypothetical protein
VHCRHGRARRGELAARLEEEGDAGVKGELVGVGFSAEDPRRRRVPAVAAWSTPELGGLDPVPHHREKG